MSIKKPRYLENPLLATERLILRKFTIGDAMDVFEYASDPEVARYVTWEAHKSIGDSINFINWTLGRYDCDEAGEWAMQCRESGKVIGAMGFVQLDDINSCGAIGYVLSKKYWGKGYMTEAAIRLIRFGFEEMGLNRIEAIYFPENKASGRVMEKAGMLFEGLMKQKVYSKGLYRDVKQYAVAKSDWRLKA